MLISTAAAQTAGGGGLFGDGAMLQILPLVLIFLVFYFLLIRPQQRKVREHRELIAGIRRNDVVVTGGGIVGKVTKVVDDHTVQVEIAGHHRVGVDAFVGRAPQHDPGPQRQRLRGLRTPRPRLELRPLDLIEHQRDQS